jgi:uncharacterized protein (DUF885 family)
MIDWGSGDRAIDDFGERRREMADVRQAQVSGPVVSRRQALLALAAGVALPLAPGCSSSTAMTEEEAARLLDEIADRLLELSPERATSLGIDEGARQALRSRASDLSTDGMARLERAVREDLDRLNAVDASGLPHSLRTSVAVVKTAYGLARGGFALPYGDVAVGSWRNSPYVVIQNCGAYLDVPRFLDSEHPIRNAADAEAYLARLEAFSKQLDGELGRIQAARAQGLVPPAFLLDKAIPQLQGSAKNARQGGTLVESIERRTKDIPGDWAARARSIAADAVAPALDRQIAELQTQRAAATNDAGMWARPRGEEYYRWALGAATTTTLTPDEVHDLGFEELKTLQAEMDGILRGLGYTAGTVGARMTALGKDPRFLYPDNDAGRAEIMADIQKRLDWIRARMPRAFNTLVQGNVEVRRLPPEEEPGAPAAYGGGGSIDGKIPGRFWLNLRTTTLHTRFGIPSLTFHESIPGHVWQQEYTFRLPLIRTLLSFNAYSEGWALYAEQLAAELGAYEADPVGRLGYLQAIAFRACRLVVDTGLHAKRWTRDQAIAWMHDNTGNSVDEVSGEVDRYCSWPGQACGYKVGHSEINRQRDRARRALGNRFDLRAFNDTVVGGGNVPLDVLATNVAEYITTQKGVG